MDAPDGGDDSPAPITQGCCSNVPRSTSTHPATPRLSVTLTRSEAGKPGWGWKPLTCTAVDWLVLAPPFPIWPKSSFPQHFAAPCVVSAHVWPQPALTCVARKFHAEAAGPVKAPVAALKGTPSGRVP